MSESVSADPRPRASSRLQAKRPAWWRRPGVWVLALVLGLALGFQGARGLWGPDEGRYVAVAMHMLHTGDWMHPALDTEMPHYSKPPMTYWLLAGAIGLLGRFEFAARLPVGLAFAAAAGGVGLIARRLVPGRAWIAVVLYGTSVLPFVAANIITTDTFLTCFEVLAMVGFVYAWTAPPSTADRGELAARARGPSPPLPGPGDRPPALAHNVPLRDRLWLPGVVVMWAGFGLAFFTKGPPGLLPLLAAIPMVGLTLGWRQLPRLFHPAALGVFFVLGFAWYVAVVVQDPYLVRYFLVDEVVNRVASNEHQRNSQWWKAFMYLPVLAGGLLPWSLDWLRPGSWRAMAGRWRRPQVRLLVLWTGIPLVVFMLAESRLPLYVLPLIAPLVLLTARLQPLDWLSRGRGWGFLVGVATALLAFRLVLGLVPNHKDARALAAKLPIHPDTRGVVFVSSRPAYGVSLYTDRPVEGAPPKRDPNVEHHYPLLSHELAEREGRVTFVVSAPGWPKVRAMLKQYRWRVLDARPDHHHVAVDARPMRLSKAR